jgi:hypothetical protein
MDPSLIEVAPVTTWWQANSWIEDTDMQTGFESPLAPVDRARLPSVMWILVATFAMGLATGILLSRVSSGADQASGVLIVDAPRTTMMLDAWRLAVPAVPAAPAVSNTMIDPWRLGDPGRAVPSRMIDSWRLAGSDAGTPGR